MNVTVNNISSSPVSIRELYTTIPVGGSVTFKRSAAEVAVMRGLQQAVADGLVTVAAVDEAYELASNLIVTLS